MAWIGPKGLWAARWHFWVTGTILIVACGAAWAWIRHASILQLADSAIGEQSVQETAASGSHDHEAEGENENPPGHDHPAQSAEPDEHNPSDNAGEGHDHSESDAIK